MSYQAFGRMASRNCYLRPLIALVGIGIARQDRLGGHSADGESAPQ